jgi:hypothetical protein
MLAAWLCRVPVRVHTFTGLIFPTEQWLKQNMPLKNTRRYYVATTLTQVCA